MQTAETVRVTPNLEEVIKGDKQSMSGPAPCDLHLRWHLQLDFSLGFGRSVGSLERMVDGQWLVAY